jgi:hypothetical protein
VTFHMDCSSGAGGRVRRGVSGEEGGGMENMETHTHTQTPTHFTLTHPVSQKRAQSEMAVHRAEQNSKL